MSGASPTSRRIALDSTRGTTFQAPEFRKPSKDFSPPLASSRPAALSSYQAESQSRGDVEYLLGGDTDTMPELSQFQREVFLVLLGVFATGLVGALGFALKRFFERDPVDTFIRRHERLLASSSSAGVPLRAGPQTKLVEQALTSLSVEAAPSEPPLSADVELETQADMNRYAASQFAKAMQTLEQKLAEALRLLDGERNRALRESQVTWSRYRDLFAGAVADSVAGGSMWPLLYDSERTTMTERRIEEIEALLQQEHVLG